jgi:N6-L-threonylcarbamoyladenine synthase
MPVVLGIETSCDETAVAIVDDERRVRAHVLFSQVDLHGLYGGVVPEIAARAHLERLDRLIDQALHEAGLGFADLDAIAVTAGPGLIGGLMVGVVTAKVICIATSLPLIAVNHLEAHALTARFTDRLAFPYTLLLVSGGHCQLLVVEGVGSYRRLGSTIDDAVGEAFDKVAKMLGLGHPGGPLVEAAAEGGDPGAFPLPRPLTGQKSANFSFSGLKTAVRQTILSSGRSDEAFVRDLAASFQAAVADCLADRTKNALRSLAGDPAARALVVAGGVAANQVVRARLAKTADAEGARLVLPPLALCGDNGVMVAWAGLERLALGLTDTLDAKARPRWPLDETAEKLPGAGVKA